jgi:hypothetical protein
MIKSGLGLSLSCRAHTYQEALGTIPSTAKTRTKKTQVYHPVQVTYFTCGLKP